MSKKVKNQTSKILNQGGEWSKTTAISTNGSGNFSASYPVNGIIRKVVYTNTNFTTASTITIKDDKDRTLDSHDISTGNAIHIPLDTNNNLFRIAKSITIAITGGQASKAGSITVYYMSGWE